MILEINIYFSFYSVIIMPSSSIYTANKMNQKLKDLLSCTFPIRWFSEVNEWSNGSNFSWKRLMFLNVIWKTCTATILLLVPLYLVLFHYSNLFEFHYALILVTLLNLNSGSVASELEFTFIV